MLGDVNVFHFSYKILWSSFLKASNIFRNTVLKKKSHFTKVHLAENFTVLDKEVRMGLLKAWVLGISADRREWLIKRRKKLTFLVRISFLMDFVGNRLYLLLVFFLLFCSASMLSFFLFLLFIFSASYFFYPPFPNATIFLNLFSSFSCFILSFIKSFFYHHQLVCPSHLSLSWLLPFSIFSLSPRPTLLVTIFHSPFPLSFTNSFTCHCCCNWT